jgi:hypothetical protein
MRMTEWQEKMNRIDEIVRPLVLQLERKGEVNNELLKEVIERIDPIDLYYYVICNEVSSFEELEEIAYSAYQNPDFKRFIKGNPDLEELWRKKPINTFLYVKSFLILHHDLERGYVEKKENRYKFTEKGMMDILIELLRIKKSREIKRNLMGGKVFAIMHEEHPNIPFPDDVRTVIRELRKTHHPFVFYFIDKNEELRKALGLPEELFESMVGFEYTKEELTPITVIAPDKESEEMAIEEIADRVSDWLVSFLRIRYLEGGI